ncbi:primase-helicase family protein [Pseudomonas sp. MS19]|uniref:primase-helicase family protein n=1 Tax=Pseudomonas sp. MS19 TaxID=2579939 RepID=UPI001562C6EF|nr:primase-helicase family protein [Pseudomonas sp. MS19]NRH26579.1 hypothetical protein [Pseudomonas sp. MS19]
MNKMKSLNSNENKALLKLKERFVRVPSNNGYPRFRDLDSGVEQADLGYLQYFYRQHSDSNTPVKTPQELANALTFLTGDGFKPCGPRILEGSLANLWQPPPFKYSGAGVTSHQVRPFVELLTRLFPIDEERRYFIWFLAMLVRRPGVRVLATPVLRSDHGVGKGFLAETLIAGLLGQPSVAVCSLKDVVGDFNDVLEGKTFILIDEVYRSKGATVNALKSVQGNSTIALRRKFKPTITIPNYLSFMITSNDHIPITIETGDRRFWVPKFMKHKESVDETGRFINSVLKPWLQEGGFQLVRDYLERVNLDVFGANSAPPMTESKKDLMGFNANDRLVDVIGVLLESLPVVTVERVRGLLTDDNLNRMSDRTIASALLDCGCEKKSTTHHRFYITPYGKQLGLSKNSTPKELFGNFE